MSSEPPSGPGGSQPPGASPYPRRTGGWDGLYSEDFVTPRGFRRPDGPVRITGMPPGGQYGPENRPPGFVEPDPLLRRENRDPTMDPLANTSLEDLHRMWLIRDPDLKLTLLPENPATYSDWRFPLKPDLLGYVAFDPDLMERFYNKLDTKVPKEFRESPLHPTLRRVDAKFYRACVNACNPNKQSPLTRYLRKLQTECVFSAGRMAVKALDKPLGYQASHIATQGSKEFNVRNCYEMLSLEEYVTETRLSLQKVGALEGNRTVDVLGVTQIKEAIETIKDEKLSAAMANWGTMPSHMHTIVYLLDILENLGTQHKMNIADKKAQDQMARGKALLGAIPTTTTSKFQGDCRWCRKPGHKQQDCKAKAAGLPRTPAKPKGPGPAPSPLPQGDGQVGAGMAVKKQGKNGKQKKPKGPGGGAANVECYRCGQKGHYANKCPNKQQQQQRGPQLQQQPHQPPSGGPQGYGGSPGDWDPRVKGFLSFMDERWSAYPPTPPVYQCAGMPQGPPMVRPSAQMAQTPLTTTPMAPSPATMYPQAAPTAAASSNHTATNGVAT